MSLGQPNFSSLLEEESTPNQNINIGAVKSGKTNKKSPVSNKKAASQSRANGAKTRSEMALESVIQGQNQLLESQKKSTKVKETQNSMITLMDKVGQLSPEEAQSPETYSKVKQIAPNLTPEQYSSLAEKAQKRATVTRQLARLPVGTQLPPESLKKLKSIGIDNPSK